MPGTQNQLPRDAAPAREWLLAVGLLLTVVLAGGCSRESSNAPSEPSAEPRIEEVRQADITVSIKLEPGKVMLDRDLSVTITVTAPPEVDPEIPPLADRLTGFFLTGEYDDDPVHESGKTIHRRYAQLSPTLSKEYRIAPIAITYAGGWMATPPVVLERAAPDVGAAASVGDMIGPRWVPPAFRSVLYGLLAIAALIVVVLTAIRLLRRVRREKERRQASPKERALDELSGLLAQGLPEKGMVKLFYFELTMIVRRYIERAHDVHAPEQTTEEFLEAVSRDPRFDDRVVEKLQQFLQSADLVKYAAFTPSSDAVSTATTTARQYIESDADRQAA